MEKPSKLYRGISVNHEIFENLNLTDDMLPPNPPKFNEDGRKVVGDGNEYGVYMTDNKLMAIDVYGNCHGFGSPLGTVGKQYFALPLIGVTFEIDTTNLDVRNPWITGSLEAVYNNGYGGKEWIADRIPSKNYKISRVIIGNDTLNKSIVIDCNRNFDEIKKEVHKIIKRRAEGLRLCMFHASKRPNTINLDMNLYKELFSENGIAFDKSLKFDETNPLSIVRNLIKVEYEKNKENLHYQELNYLLKIKSNLKSSDTIEKIYDLVQIERKQKINTLEKQKQNGINTKRIEKDIDFLNNTFNYLENYKQSPEKQ